MSKKSGSKSYPAELREKAVKLATERGYTIAQVAAQLGCSQESVRRWKESAAKKLDPAIAQRMEQDEDENKRLRSENKRLQMEVDILKKATAYFAKEVL
jgi:transposase